MLPGRRDGLGRLYINAAVPPAASAGSAYLGGIQLSSTGQVYITAAPAVSDQVINGFRVSALGQLVITPGGVVATFQEGIPRDSNSAVVTLANGTPVPIPGAVMGPELAVIPYTDAGSSGLWAVSSSAITRNGSATGDGRILTLATGLISYRISFTISDFSGDGMFVSLGGGAASPQISGNGVKEVVVVSGGSSQIRFAPWVGAVGEATITNISLREVDTSAYNMLGGLCIANNGLYTTDATPSILAP